MSHHAIYIFHLASEASIRIKNKLEKTSYITTDEVKGDIYYVASCGTAELFNEVYISISERYLNSGVPDEDVSVAINNSEIR